MTFVAIGALRVNRLKQSSGTEVHLNLESLICLPLIC